MIEFEGIWFPDHEEHLKMIIDRFGPYQQKKYDAVMGFVTDRTRVIDVGGHVGLWAVRFVEDFENVEAFEPVEEHRECFEKNVTGANLYPYACGDKVGKTSIETTIGSSGNSYLVEGDDVDVVTIDSFNFKDVGLIKLDCEGYELYALRGAEQTILDNRPMIIVEQKKQNKDRYGLKDLSAVTYLESLGMKVRQSISGDYILTW